MTDRLYYSDAYKTEFQAQVVERLQHQGKPAIVLDQTYFYPDSGGQPCDYGWIDGVPVVQVIIRPADNAIVHVLSAAVNPLDVKARIDWPRRFDHMQQHTGQHLLSQAFVRIAEAETISFHLGSGSCTIDLDLPSLDDEQLDRAEALANEIVWQNRHVNVQWAHASEVVNLPLRRLPDVNGDKFRLIDIADFDLTACGGTHVNQTGEVGQVKILGIERRGESLRVEFVCGLRALLDYRRKNQIINRLSAELTTGHEELSNSVASLQEQVKEATRRLRSQGKELFALRAAEMLSGAPTIEGARLVTQLLEGYEPGEVRLLANKLVEYPRTVAFLALTGSRLLLVFARSDDAPGEMDRLLRECLTLLGSGKGGGTSTFAQGGGPAVDRSVLLAALAETKQRLEEVARQ